jgi:hypothetical protein
MKPIGQVYSNQSIWYIQYTHEVRRPGSNAYIRFYSKLTNNQVDEINVRTDLNRVIYSDNHLTFFTSIKWNLVSQKLFFNLYLRSFLFRVNNITFYSIGIIIRLNKNEGFSNTFSSIVTDPMVCGPQSPPIVDTNYWTFQVADADTGKLIFSFILTLNSSRKNYHCHN